MRDYLDALNDGSGDGAADLVPHVSRCVTVVHDLEQVLALVFVEHITDEGE